MTWKSQASICLHTTVSNVPLHFPLGKSSTQVWANGMASTPTTQWCFAASLLDACTLLVSTLSPIARPTNGIYNNKRAQTQPRGRPKTIPDPLILRRYVLCLQVRLVNPPSSLPPDTRRGMSVNVTPQTPLFCHLLRTPCLAIRGQRLPVQFASRHVSVRDPKARIWYPHILPGTCMDSRVPVYVSFALT